MRDQAEVLRRWRGMRANPAGRNGNSTRPNRKARVIAVSSGKGGVGKTTVATNLGILLAQRGVRVGILDADLGLANVDLLLGLSSRYNLAHVLFGEKDLSEIELEGPAGLRVYPGGSGLTEMANLDREQLERFLAGLSILDERLDLLLIDTGAGVAHGVTSFLWAADEVLLVTTPEPPAVTDAYAVIKSMSHHNPDTHLHLVVNMVTSPREAEGVYRNLNLTAQRFLRKPCPFELLGHVPADSRTRRAVIQQQPLALAHPGARFTRALETMATELHSVGTPGGQGVAGLFDRLLRRIRPLNEP